MSATTKIEFGDFQTPLALAQEVCTLLVQRNVEAATVIEPTCGVGAFLSAAGEAFPKARLMGWDINRDYVERTKSALKQTAAGNWPGRTWFSTFARIGDSSTLKLSVRISGVPA